LVRAALLFCRNCHGLIFAAAQTAGSIIMFVGI
jgi:hypothetical protein